MALKLAVLTLTLPLLAATAAAADAAPSNSTRVENVTINWAPAAAAVVEGQRPTVRWVIPRNASRPPGTVQRSYRFQLRQSWSAPGPGIAFDSGVVASAETAAAYPGAGVGRDGMLTPALLPDQQYAVMLEVALSDGSVLSGSSGLKTGLQSDARSAWDGAAWIAGDAALPASPGLRKNNLRREWTLEAAPSSASAFVAGIGYHEFYCNGVKQGIARAKLQPGLTNCNCTCSLPPPRFPGTSLTPSFVFIHHAHRNATLVCQTLSGTHIVD